MSVDFAKKLASDLLTIQAVKLSPKDPFTWASGLKSPVYCDNRLTLSYPEVRENICAGLCEIIQRKFSGVGGIAGVATAGIPHGMLVADRLKLPFLYVRSKPKEHGLSNQIEGRLDKNLNYIVIEDLVSTGKSSLEAIQALRTAGGFVSGLVSVFSYGFEKANTAFAQAAVEWESLSNYKVLVKLAAETGYIKAQDLEKLNNWAESPEKWSESQV